MPELSESAASLTRLLRATSEDGNLDELAPRVYDRLRRLASASLGRERGNHTLEPTALANEVWVRLSNQLAAAGFNDRKHFFAAASRALRHILVDHARRRRSRGMRTQLELDQADVPGGEQGACSLDVLALNEALEELRRSDPELARLVDLRYFGGLTIHETAHTLGVGAATIKRRWTFVRAWLFRRLETTRNS